MFNAKNLTPRQLSVIAAGILALSVSLVVIIVNKNWQLFLITLISIFVIGYFLIYYIFDHFIYRNIKQIYKFIYQKKATKKEETYYKYILPKKSLQEVSNDVQSWADHNQAQMELLTNNVQFRKEFLQNLAHEFKTPVFALQGYTEMLLYHNIDDPITSKKFLQKISSNVTRLTNLLNDLDEISSLEHGEININKTNFIIQDIIKDTFESISIKAVKSNIQLKIKKGCEFPINVYADKEKISQVLLNLFENAIKYGKKDSFITASIYRTDMQRILIEISDEGIGISEENLPRVFERFFRTDKGRSVDTGGSGLGLAICKHIIEAHNENIHIRSRENIGTTIGFTLSSKKG